MLHIFNGPCYTKNEKYMKKRACNHVIRVFFIFSCSKVHQKYATWVLPGVSHQYFSLSLDDYRMVIVF